MPWRPKSPCSHPGCPALAVRRGRCEVHARQAEAEYRKRNPDTRPSAAQRGYDAKWRRIRAAYLRAHPACVLCGGTDNLEVDHIIPLAQGGTNKWSNLQVLCKSHHSQKTNLYDSGGWRNG
jgi:5-methylcytosine-specific restriction enzyme A